MIIFDPEPVDEFPEFPPWLDPALVGYPPPPPQTPPPPSGSGSSLPPGYPPWFPPPSTGSSPPPSPPPSTPPPYVPPAPPAPAPYSATPTSAVWQPPVTNYIPGSTWNMPEPYGPREAPTGPPGFGGGMQWTERPGSGTGGPERTGQAMPFSPYGTQQGISSEILRYGGQPNSGAGGSWTGSSQAAPMQEMFGASGSGGSAAGKLDPFDIYNSAILEALRSGTTIQDRPTLGEAYQNVVISARDGEVWKDPNTGQDYVFYNGKWNKADLEQRPGPVERTYLPEGMIWITANGINPAPRDKPPETYGEQNA